MSLIYSCFLKIPKHLVKDFLIGAYLFPLGNMSQHRSLSDNRGIIGYSAGTNKDAALVHRAFSTVQYNLHELEMFHTDRGKEFDNALIDEALQTFEIKRSLSDKGSPYDNAVAKATFKSIKNRIRTWLCATRT